MALLAYGSLVTIVRSSSTEPDHFGSLPTPVITRIDVPGCSIAPRYSSEPTVRDRQGVIVGITLLVPPGITIYSTDKVELYGGGTIGNSPSTPSTAKVYWVEGEPGIWYNPLTGVNHGTEVALTLGVG